MDKFKNINVKKYTFDTKLKTSSPSIDKQCFAFGYLDGFMDEELYKQYLNNEKSLEYDLGYQEAKSLKKDLNLKIVKEIWLLKLAVFDAQNKKPRKGFSEEAEAIYSLNYQDVLNDENNIEQDFFEESEKLGYGEFSNDPAWGFTFYDLEKKKKL